MALADELGRALWFVALDDDPKWLDQLGELFVGSEDLRMAGGTGQEGDVPRLVAENGADLLLVDHGLAGRSGLLVAAGLAKRLPAVRVYLMAESPTADLWQEARRRGLRGVVKKPFDAATLVRRVREDLEIETRVTSGLAPGPAEGGPAAPAGPEPPRSIAVFSFKGGVGKSLVAVSLALAAGAPTSRRRRAVVLVDAEEGVGSTATLLGAVPRPTLLDWAEYRGERQVDPAIAMRKLAETKAGLHCLFAPGELDQSVDRELMETVLGTLPRLFGLVVVDCAPAVTDAVYAALRASTTVLVVVEPTLDCLDKVRKGVQSLLGAGLGPGKFRLLVNRCRPGSGDFSAAEVREALGLQVLGTLPFDPAAKRSGNRRRPLALEAPRGPFMTGLCRALDGMLPGIGSGSGRRRLFGR